MPLIALLVYMSFTLKVYLCRTITQCIFIVPLPMVMSRYLVSIDSKLDFEVAIYYVTYFTSQEMPHPDVEYNQTSRRGIEY